MPRYLVAPSRLTGCNPRTLNSAFATSSPNAAAVSRSSESPPTLANGRTAIVSSPLGFPPLGPVRARDSGRTRSRKKHDTERRERR